MKANSQRQRAVWGPAGERLIAANEIAGAAAVVMPNVCVEVATGDANEEGGVLVGAGHGFSR
ncbi:MAG: hypothetical protein L0K86_29050, partial [Actinomycetia bacterium]|nr:hypothetical protein [Actinomycetes bacterium]